MHRTGPALRLSATDLANFLGCRHRTALDMAVADGARKRPFVHNPLLDVLRQRGIAHEKQYVDTLRAAGRGITDLSTVDDMGRRAEATRQAMDAGDDVIVQGALTDDSWHGLPDVMLRVSLPSRLGAWSYEIADTKLARETRAGTMLQLALYSEMLGAIQGVRPERFYVVTPDPVAPIHAYRVDDYAAYFRFVRARMLSSVSLGADTLAAAHYPEPVEHCVVCQWAAECATRRRADDHLSLVAGITAMQRHALEANAVSTLTALAELPMPFAFRPRRGTTDSYVRVREQARLQHASRGRMPPLHDLLPVEPEKGLCRLPEPSPGDLFLDLEGDPLAIEGGREYLFGLAFADGTYRSAWAVTAAEERRAFEWVIDTIIETARAHPTMHVYHYAPYEPAALKRLMGRYATRERELDAMLRAGRFVDLYAVSRQALRAGVERYSIKNLEPLYDFTREVDLVEANRCRSAMEHALEIGSPDVVPAWVRDKVEGYNRDDCVSTLRLRDWLETRRAAWIDAGVDVPRRTLTSGDAPPEVDDRARRVEALRVRLLDGIPDGRADCSAAQQARWLLAYMLDYHRREQKSTWWEYYRLCDLDEDELLDERDAIAGLSFVDRIDVVRHKKTGKPTGTVIDRYRYPPQEIEIEPGADVWLQDRTSFGTVVAVDRAECTIDVRKGRARAEIHPTAMFAFTHVSTEPIEESLMRIGEGFVSDEAAPNATRALLTAGAPRLTAGTIDVGANESATDAAIRAVGALDRTVLAIQGPPGAGKTYCGARMIRDLVRQGKKVGVTATSHAVIRNLLRETLVAGDEARVALRIAHKEGDDAAMPANDRIRRLDDNAAARDALQTGEIDILGGTAWMWARPEFAGAVDVLFVDEAGQMAIPNVVAVSPAASSVVLLGDPQQLEQPRRGSHPDGVDVSALEHMLGGDRTIAADRGIFLPETWRLAPAVCEFTSEVFYERRLAPRRGLERQALRGVVGLPATGLHVIDVEHDGNRSASDEEAAIVAELLGRLTDGASTWVDANGNEDSIKTEDVLVVAPYNAHVSRLAERLRGTGVRVGTVDKFQGQEAPVAIYSMATSRPEDAPRGMEFLYSLNRLNVATSRARCLAIIVASRRLFEPECRTPRQMKLANALCRFRELARGAE